MNGAAYSEDADDGYDSAGEYTPTQQAINLHTSCSEFNSLNVDEQIAVYEQLQNIMYPNKRLKVVAARNSHLRQSVYYPPAAQDKPRTELEKQWMKEHSRLGSITVDRKSGRRQTLHESFLSHRDDVCVSDTRASTLCAVRPKERVMSLAQLAEIADYDEFPDYYDDSNIKNRILRSLHSRTDMDLNRQSGSRSQLY